MKPRIFTVTIAKNEDRVIGATLDAWAPFAERMLVMDTGSVDETARILERREANIDFEHLFLSVRSCEVGASMIARQLLIDFIPREENVWMLTLDADEVWPEPQIRALIDRMSDPEIDFLAVRPVALGQDLVSMYAPYYFEPEKIEDRAKFSTEHWCDKWSTRAYRASRGVTVTDARWGCEVYSVPVMSGRDKITPDFKEEPVPPGHVSTMFTGRTAWTDIYFLHLTNFTRSTKWREIPQIPGSNAMDRARWRNRGRNGEYPFPYFHEVPESVRAIAAGESAL